MQLQMQRMSRLAAERILQYYPLTPIYRFHPTEPDLLIVSYLYEGRPRHTLLERGSTAFREIQLVNGRRSPLTNWFRDTQELEAFMEALLETEDPKELCPLSPLEDSHSLSPLEDSHSLSPLEDSHSLSPLGFK
jgi:hypothetical protein